MSRRILQIFILMFATSSIAGWAQASKDGTYISDEDVKAVLKHSVDTKRTIPDNTIKVVDMGSYQLGIAVIHRGAMGGPRPAGANGVGGAATANPVTPCGDQRPGATGPNGILHTDTAETYYITSGNATLIMGGTIVNGRKSGPSDEVTTILNGPSCSGIMVGYTSQDVKPGDIVVIPEGVPHGFSAVPDHLTYVSMRPDLKKVLQRGYVNPALKK